MKVQVPGTSYRRLLINLYNSMWKYWAAVCYTEIE